jgi:phosphate starvation-inducible membrane PsiE
MARAAAYLVILDLVRLILIQHEDKFGVLMSSPASTLNVTDHGLQWVEADDQVASREI